MRDRFAILFYNYWDHSEITGWHVINLIFLPTNTTSKTQPMARVASCCYRINMVQSRWDRKLRVIMSESSVKEEDTDKKDGLKKNFQLPDSSKTLWKLQKVLFFLKCNAFFGRVTWRNAKKYSYFLYECMNVT